MNHCYRRSTGVASRVVDGEAVLVKLPEGRLFILNPAASRIWVEADGRRSGADLAEEWGGAEVQAFFDEMVEMGLFERTDSPGATADQYPQDVEWPQVGVPPQAPRIRASEVIEALAGLCNFSITCSVAVVA